MLLGALGGVFGFNFEDNFICLGILGVIELLTFDRDDLCTNT